MVHLFQQASPLVLKPFVKYYYSSLKFTEKEFDEITDYYSKTACSSVFPLSPKIKSYIYESTFGYPHFVNGMLSFYWNNFSNKVEKDIGAVFWANKCNYFAASILADIRVRGFESSEFTKEQSRMVGEIFFSRGWKVDNEEEELYSEGKSFEKMGILIENIKDGKIEYNFGNNILGNGFLSISSGRGYTVMLLNQK